MKTDGASSLSPHKVYALGLFSVQLPGDMSAPISDNGALVLGQALSCDGQRP